MTGDTTVSKVSRIEVIQTGSRRRWTPEEKLRIIAESMAAPRLVCAVARRHGLSANQLFVWRRLYREGKLGGGEGSPGFVPAIVSPDCATFKSDLGQGRIEIVLSEPRRLIVDSEIDANTLARMVSVLGGR